MIATVTDEPKKRPGRPPSGNPLRVHVGVKLPESLAKALESYINAQAVPPGPPAVMRAALERFLEAEGYWPADE